jgi:hypothetical protein
LPFHLSIYDLERVERILAFGTARDKGLSVKSRMCKGGD